MSATGLAGAMYANQRIRDSLVERIRCQNGSEKLDLSLCNIRHVPLQMIADNFDGCPQHLDLSYNIIPYIMPEFTYDMIHLTKLDLSRNQLRKLPDNFGEMQELVYLDLHNNQLQTLPISMGKMRRLSFLRVSNNPFRPPLKDFLGEREPSVSAVAMAGLVVQFLDEFASVHAQQISQSHGSIPCEKRRSSRVHYRGRNKGMGLTGNSSLSSIASAGGGDGDVFYSNRNSNAAGAPEQSTKTTGTFSLPKFLRALTITLVATVTVFAYYVDTSYLDAVAERYPTFNMLWSLYKPYHQSATLLTTWIPKSIWHLTRADVIQQEQGFLAKIGSWFRG